MSSTALASNIVETNVRVNNSDFLVYTTDFFDQYSPQNALEMIERLPGFSFDEGSENRGFGGNAGNVLIDGSRPTSKSNGLSSVLQRIPAEQVLRIEIITGGVSAGEAAGQSVVANVIRANIGTSGTWRMQLFKTRSTAFEPEFEAAITAELGEWNTSFDVSIGNLPEYRPAVLTDRDAKGELTSSSNEVFEELTRKTYFSGEGSRSLADGKLTLNSRVGSENWQGDTSRDIFLNRKPDNSTADWSWVLNQKNKSREAEFGADWAKNIDNWKLRIIGLGLVEDETYSFKRRNIGDSFDSTFQQERLKTEYVGRATYGKVNGSTFKPEFGFELASNRLDTNAIESNNGIFSAVAGSDVIVQEWRGELFATFVYQMNEQLTLEGGLTGEFSQLKVEGGSDLKQDFQFLKPRISATYTLNDDIKLIFEAEHEIGQLDFKDFAASSEASDDRTTSGNPSLKPDQSTVVKATVDWRFSDRGSFKWVLFNEWRKDILEQIVLSVSEDGEVSQGLGNAGDANHWGVNIELNLPLDWVLPNGLLEVTYERDESAFYDPIIGRERVENEYNPYDIEFELRQDLAEQKIAWGFKFDGNFEETEFLVDEYNNTKATNDRVGFFIETTRFFGLKIQLDIDKATRGKFDRSRYFFDGTRAGTFEGSQVSKRIRYTDYKLSLWGSF
ncbi:TonB-dependent receptor domain-containing protein [Colwellia sp. RE-S-Sl-9]